MTDPVAEAAAKIAAQAAEPSLLDKAMDTIHDLEAKVEHLIHPESVPNVTPGSPAIDASATLLEPSGQSTQDASSAKPLDTSSTETPALASAIESAEPSTITPTSSAESESPNALPASTSGIAEESTPSADSGPKADVPNAVSGAVEQPVIAASAPAASTVGIQGVASKLLDEAVNTNVSYAVSTAIRSNLAAIKHHLSIRGFEQSAVADIHAELEAIEKWL